MSSLAGFLLVGSCGFTRPECPAKMPGRGKRGPRPSRSGRSRQERRSAMEILLQQIINGLILGSMYALIALGYTMVYGIINLINFAHGEVLMVGALTSWAIITSAREAMPGIPGWLLLLVALIISCVVAAALNFTIEKVAYRPLRNSPKL